VRSELLEITEFAEATPESHPLLRGARLARPVQSVQRVLHPLLDVDELRSGIRLRTSDFTGAASFVARLNDSSRAQIRAVVKPRNPFLQLSDVLGMLAVTDLGRWSSGVLPAEGGEDHVDALCRAMVQESKRLIKRGLARSYAVTVRDLRAPKGRIDTRRAAIQLLTGQQRVRCRYTVHTLQNPYNEYVAAGISAARVVAGNTILRRSASRLLNTSVEPPRPDLARRPMRYGGQFAEYRTPHDIAELLLDGLGLSGVHGLRAAFVPFVVETNLLFQKFLTVAISKTLGPGFEVRSERVRVFERLNTKRERVVIPDIVVRDRQTGRVVLVLDAKYETAFPVIGASDYYQAYVYGDVIGRMNEPRPLPIVLAGPFSETSPIAWERVAERLDARAHKPITWLVGVDVPDLLRSVSGRRATANHALKTALVATGAAVA
jgi:hypothetical protein